MTLHTTNKDLQDVRLNFIDGTTKARFECKFLEPGIVSYAEERNGGIELLQKETIDKALNSFIGKPLIIRHNGTEAHGKIEEVKYNADDGWYYASGPIETEEAQKSVKKGWKVSCAYRVNSTKVGGTWHNIPYKQEISEIEFEHLAIVPKSRYEGATIRLNGLVNWVKGLADMIIPSEQEGNLEIDINGKAVKLNELIETYLKANEGVEPEKKEVPPVLNKEKEEVKHEVAEIVKEEKGEVKTEPVLHEPAKRDGDTHEGNEGKPHEVSHEASDPTKGLSEAKKEETTSPTESTITLKASDPLNPVALSDSKETQANSKAAVTPTDGLKETLHLNGAYAPMFIMEMPLVQPEPALRKLNEKEEGLKHYNDLKTARERFLAATIVQPTVDINSEEHRKKLAKMYM